MRVSDAGLALIKRYEGFSHVTYLCPAGWPTIGYGHVVKKGEAYPGGISQKRAEELLQADIASACNSVIRLTRTELNQPMFDALVSFTYNLGAGNYQSSTLRQKLNRGDYEGAMLQFGRWTKAGGRKLPGLIRRREEEAAMFRAGIELMTGTEYVLPWQRR